MNLQRMDFGLKVRVDLSDLSADTPRDSESDAAPVEVHGSREQPGRTVAETQSNRATQ